ncbi:MAG: hypothetical protein K2G85_03600, partial [Muribaculaceae bacterium]|nr:hypothetical protein [Muribaculaceae bacterium]
IYYCPVGTHGSCVLTFIKLKLTLSFNFCELLFDPDGNVGLFKHASMISDLENLLKKSVDLVSEGSLFPWVKENVDNDKILIYERETTQMPPAMNQ